MSSSRRARATANPLQSAKPRPAVRRAGSGGGSSASSRSSGGGLTAATTAATATAGDDDAASAAPRASKLRANRERRRRELSMDEDDLDNKFSNLSVSAPSFTPLAMRASGAASPVSSVAAPTASWLAKAKPPQRRVPPAHQRQQQRMQQQQSQQPLSQPPATPVPKAPTPMSQWSSSTAAAAASGKARAQQAAGTEPQGLLAAGRAPAANGAPGTAAAAPPAERRPRRQRIGTLGFARSGMSMNRRTPQTSAASSATASSTSGTSFNSSFQLSSAPSSSPSETAPAGGARKRSDSVGSEGDYSSDDEVYPDASAPAGVQAPSAFPERLMLLSQQKKVPMSVVSRDAVIDTVFSALFAKKEKARSDTARRFSAFGDDTSGTETDEPNEEFVKRGLAASLFKDSLSGMTLQLERRREGMTDQEAIERFITPAFVHTLVNDMRFEDFRTASARIDIVRAIHKSCPTKRIHIARALADAATQRLQYVQALLSTAQRLEIEKQRVMVKHANDHSHGFTDLLRYAIEHVGESLNGITGESADAALISQREVDEIVRNCLAALVSLWKTHWFDPAGSDDEELISCAGQFVAYIPRVAVDLLERLLRNWPARFPAMEVIAIRMVARVVMTSPPLHTLEDTPRLPFKLFSRLAKCVRSPHTQVAQEALAFTGCQFAMVHFLGQYDEIYHVVSQAFHENARSHWNDVIRTTSEGHFDRALDYAP